MKQLLAFVFAWWFLYQPIGTSGKYLAGPFAHVTNCEAVRAQMVYAGECFFDGLTQ